MSKNDYNQNSQNDKQQDKNSNNQTSQNSQKNSSKNSSGSNAQDNQKNNYLERMRRRRLLSGKRYGRFDCIAFCVLRLLFDAF